MNSSEALHQALTSRDSFDYIERVSGLIDFLLAGDELALAAEECEALLKRSRDLKVSLRVELQLTTSLTEALLVSANIGAAAIAAERLVRLVDGSPGLAPSDKSRDLAVAATAFSKAGRPSEARKLSKRSFDLALSSGEALTLARAKRTEAVLFRAEWRLAEATTCLTQAISIFQVMGQNKEVAALQTGLAGVLIRQRRFREALAVIDGQPDSIRVEARCVRPINRAICCMFLGDHATASSTLTSVERLAHERGQKAHHAVALCLQAELSRRQGDLETAKPKIEQARAIEMPVRSREHTICIEYAGKIEADLGNRKAAIKLFREALAIEEQVNPKSDTVSECLRHIADNLIALGQYGQAIDYAKRCLDLSRTNYEAIEVAAALRALANAQSRLDKPEEAESLFQESIAGFRAVEEPYELAIALHDLAVHGLREDALDVDVMARVTEAEGLFERLGTKTWLERTRQLRAEAIAQLPLTAGKREGSPGSRRSTRRRQPDAKDTCGFITSDAGLLKELKELVLVSQVDIPVLITGERGTGKEIFAQEVHRLSKREGKLIALNCAAIPSELQEATFFGHARGSFTGAIADRQGAFELAQNGTLFLDEIGDMSLEAQAKLLRVLEEKKIWRIGDSKPRDVSARIVAATNRNIHELVRSGRFRPDLFDRLDGHAVDLTPLRTRRDDIDLLIDYLLDEANRETGRNVRFPEELRKLYKRYPWPGNVRELAQDVKRLVAHKLEGDADVEHSRVWKRLKGGEEMLEPEGGSSPTLLEIQRQAIREAMERADGNQSQAARILGLSRTTLIGRMKRLGIID